MSIHFRFESDSPTQFNISRQLMLLGGKKSRYSPCFSDANLSLNQNATNLLEYKHNLVHLLNKYQLDVSPLSYVLDEHNYSQILSCLPGAYSWILKPALLNNAEGIELFNNVDEIDVHYQQNNRYTGPHVLQRYLNPPHLLNGHKYSFRLFVLITNFKGAYLYPQGYFNVAIEPYHADLTDKAAHLTNEHLHTERANVYQIPTVRCPNFTPMFAEMQTIVESVLCAFQQETNLLTSQGNAFSLFGFDFLVDSELDCWLLECNHGPCFPVQAHPLDALLYQPFWQDICQNFVIPIAYKRTIAEHSEFIRVA